MRYYQLDQDVDILAFVNDKLRKLPLNLPNYIYGAGAWNFLILNDPPFERTWQPEDAEILKSKFESDVALLRSAQGKSPGKWPSIILV